MKTKSYNFGYDVSSLSNYTDPNEDLLLVRSFFGAKSASLMTKQTGIKSADQLNVMATDAIFQTGGVCDWSPSGTTTFTARTLTIGKILVAETICPSDLEAKWTQLKLTPGSQYESMPFEQFYSEFKADIIAEQIETAIWQGDTNHGNANLSKFDGLIKLIDAASGVTQANASAYLGQTAITTAVGFTTANMPLILDAMTLALPKSVLGKADVAVFCGMDLAQKALVGYKNLNLFHYNITPGVEGIEFIIPGSNTKLIAVNGLNSTNRLFAARTSNLYLGCDLQNEEDQFSIWYSADFDQVRFRVKFKMGTQVAFPNEIVKFTLV